VCHFLFSHTLLTFSIAPKIIILGPPASGRHTIAKMLQKKLKAIIIEPDDLLHDVPSKLKDKLPVNPTVVCI
jgi:tRNA uridine 5-carbamoylmethylation protein Kti12